MKASSSDALFFRGRRPLVIAHRGAAISHPENTMPSFVRALACGADVLECDVHLSADGEVVVIHDFTVDRTTGGNGLVAELTWGELSALDAGYRFTTNGGESYPFRGAGVRIPRLADLLDRFPGVPVIVEIKGKSKSLVDRTLEVIRRAGRGEDGSVMIACSEAHAIRQVRTMSPGVIAGFNRREMFRFVASAWLRLGVLYRRPVSRILHLPDRRRGFPILTASVSRRARKLGVELHVWTINSEVEIRRFLALGVGGIITDDPALARRIVDEN